MTTILLGKGLTKLAIGSIGSAGMSFPTFGMGASPLTLAAPQPTPPALNPGVAMMFLQLMLGAMTQLQNGWSGFGGQQQASSGTGAANGTGAVNGQSGAGNSGFDREAAASNQRAAQAENRSGFPG